MLIKNVQYYLQILKSRYNLDATVQSKVLLCAKVVPFLGVDKRYLNPLYSPHT